MLRPQPVALWRLPPVPTARAPHSALLCEGVRYAAKYGFCAGALNSPGGGGRVALSLAVGAAPPQAACNRRSAPPLHRPPPWCLAHLHKILDILRTFARAGVPPTTGAQTSPPSPVALIEGGGRRRKPHRRHGKGSCTADSSTKRERGTCARLHGCCRSRSADCPPPRGGSGWGGYAPPHTPLRFRSPLATGSAYPAGAGGDPPHPPRKSN